MAASNSSFRQLSTVTQSTTYVSHLLETNIYLLHYTFFMGGSVAEWLVCRTQARKSTGSNRSRDAVE